MRIRAKGVVDPVVIVDSLPGLVAYWNKDLTNGYANNAYFSWYGKTPSQILGTHIKDLLGPEIFALKEGYIRACLGGEPQAFQSPHVSASGERRNVFVQYVPDIVDSQVKGFFVLVTDLRDVAPPDVISQKAIHEKEVKRCHGLTTRENQVLKLIVEGKLSKEIADLLHLSVRTVEKHRQSLMKKTGVKNAASLAHFAIANSIVTLKL